MTKRPLLLLPMIGLLFTSQALCMKRFTTGYGKNFELITRMSQKNTGGMYRLDDPSLLSISALSQHGSNRFVVNRPQSYPPAKRSYTARKKELHAQIIATLSETITAIKPYTSKNTGCSTVLSELIDELTQEMMELRFKQRAIDSRMLISLIEISHLKQQAEIKALSRLLQTRKKMQKDISLILKSIERKLDAS